MTKERAIELIEEAFDMLQHESAYDDWNECVEAREMAIKALRESD